MELIESSLSSNWLPFHKTFIKLSIKIISIIHTSSTSFPIRKARCPKRLLSPQERASSTLGIREANSREGKRLVCHPRQDISYRGIRMIPGYSNRGFPIGEGCLNTVEEASSLLAFEREDVSDAWLRHGASKIA